MAMLVPATAWLGMTMTPNENTAINIIENPTAPFIASSCIVYCIRKDVRTEKKVYRRSAGMFFI